jgi:hypothetical protein
MKRTLSLKREPLTALTDDELSGLAAASLPTWFAPQSLEPLTGCVASVRESVLQCTGTHCNTWNSDCSCRI